MDCLIVSPTLLCIYKECFLCSEMCTEGVTVMLLLQNIELKVEVESLKQELQEKQQLLNKAL